MKSGDTNETCPVFSETEAADTIPLSSIWVGRMYERRLHSLFGYSPASEDLSSCESLKLSQSDVSRWAPRFSEMVSLREIEVYRINQTSLETICLAPNLERLRIHGSRVSDISPVGSLSKLTHLCLHNGSNAESLEPLTELPDLSALYLDRSFLDGGSLDSLEGCSGLRGLWLGSSRGYGKANAFSSLRSLKCLDELRFLGIGAPIADASINPVLTLKRLNYLWLERWSQWSREDYQALYANLPNLVASTSVKSAATDEAFRKLHRIRSVG